MNELTVHDSWFKPKYKYFDITRISKKPSQKKLYLGVELEFNFGNEFERTNTLTHWKILKPWWYAVEDHSLDTWGFELVTHPMSYEWFLRHRYEFIEMLAVMKQNEPRIDNDCGMHVHLSRWSFTKAHLLRFQKFIYGYPQFIRKLSKRPLYVLDKWATLNETETEIERKTKLKMAQYNSENKNVAVNLCHKNSIEVRIFKNSTNPKDVFTAIEFCTAAWEYTKYRKKPTLAGFKVWASVNKSRYPNFYEFIE